MTDEKPPQIPLVSEVVLDFGDDTYLFKLTLKWIDALQKECGLGLGTIGRMTMGTEWNAVHIQKIIYYGLIGGGLPAVKAKKLCDLYIDGMPLARIDDPSSPLNVARSIIGAAFFGIPEDLVGKAKAPATGAMTEDTSTSQDFTEKPLQSDKVWEMLPDSLLGNS